MKIRPQKETRKDVSRSDEASKRAQNSPLAGAMREANPLASGLSGIRLQTESQEAKTLGYKAFTRGNEVHFASGEYRPDTSEGQEIIQHEAVHVRQQAMGRSRLGGFADAGTLEHQAQVQSPIVSAAPFGRIQGFSEVVEVPIEPYKFKSQFFRSMILDGMQMLRLRYFGGYDGTKIENEQAASMKAKKAFQIALNTINRNPKHKSSDLYLETDGEFGPTSQKVIMDFQKKYDLSPNGVIGEDTARKIDEVLAQVESGIEYSVDSYVNPVNNKKFQKYNARDAVMWNNEFSHTVIKVLDRNKPPHSLGWNAVNQRNEINDAIYMLKSLGYLPEACTEDNDAGLIHYRCSLQDDSNQFHELMAGSDRREFDDVRFGLGGLYMTDRVSEAALPETIKAIIKFQKAYGFPATGRLVPGEKDYELFMKLKAKEQDRRLSEMERLSKIVRIIEKASPTKGDGSMGRGMILIDGVKIEYD